MQCMQSGPQSGSRPLTGIDNHRRETHPNGPHMFLFGGSGMTAKSSVNPLHKIPQAFICRNDVERRGHGAPLLKIADP